MKILHALLLVAGLYVLARAVIASRKTSLVHAVTWCVAAWLAWGWALLAGDPEQTGLEPARYVALSLTGCAGIAVLGARRPYVFAWNFVVLGLLGVLLLPLLESQVLGTSPADPLRLLFLSATLAVGILNYLPTRSAPAACLLALACGGEVLALFAPEVLPGRGELSLFHLFLLLAPWAGWFCWRGQRTAPAFDRRWLNFRDQFGLVWGQRVREQFNAAAENARWPVTLYWQGLVRHGSVVIPADEQEKMLQTLAALLKRFQPEEPP
jgi:hypothetical protein